MDVDRNGVWGADDSRDLLQRGALMDAVGAFAFSGDRARVHALADVMAWAVTRGSPMPEALRALPGLRRWVFGLSRCTIFPLWRYTVFLRLPWRGLRWRTRVCAFIHALESGALVGTALERYLGKWLPRYFTTGVARAEREGRLAAALPVLAAELKRPVSLLSVYRQHVLVVFWRLLAIGLLLGFLGAKIAPTFDALWTEMAGQEAPQAPMAILDGRVLLTVVILAWLGLRWAPRLGRFGEWLLLPLPLFGGVWRRVVISDFAQGMAAFLRQGDDVVVAAEWCQQATRSRWMERRLNRFIGALRKGTPWLDAWEQAEIGWTFERWVLRNAAAREDPADGFELVAEWQHRRIADVCWRVRFWIEPLATLAMAVLVGYSAWFVFKSLTGWMWALAG